ncbi:MAG: serpin family protein [bacterium]|nr:serpin family protein [bacterium]
MFKRLRLSVLIVSLFLNANCGSDSITGDDRDNKIIESLPRDLTTAEMDLIGSANTFSVKLFKKINTYGGSVDNVFISPLSVSYALGMTYNGADSETKDAIADVLDFSGLSETEINDSYRSLIDLLTDLDENVEFSIANSIWYRDEFPVETPFLNTCSDYFLAEVSGLDFSQPSAVTTINNWVEDETNGKITDLVAPPIDPLTVMYLINAIYFNGSWTTQFEPENTIAGDFNLRNGSIKTVDMMNLNEYFNTASGSNFEILELPYGGKAFSMAIILPDRDTDVYSVLNDLTADELDNILSNTVRREMMVTIPRFKLKYELEMDDVLKALGMGIAFMPGTADFSRINPNEALFISKVKHKSFVDVNEEGTEAAAATSVEISLTSAPEQFIADRPFLFIIRETLSNTIVFMGKIVEPVIE